MKKISDIICSIIISFCYFDVIINKYICLL